MPSVFDVALYILENQKEITTWKLQKLVYYSQAWSMVWDEEPIFSEPIQAWSGGPVCPDLYQEHKGWFQIDASSFNSGNAENLEPHHKETIDAVLQEYGNKTGMELSDLTHREQPWIRARGSMPIDKRGIEVITLDSMADYYGKPDG